MTLAIRLPRRDPEGHKGAFGTVAVVGGCCSEGRRMIGAPALAALGALRAGAGLARLACPAPILDHAIVLCPSATGVPMPVDEDGGLLAGDAARVFDGVLGACSALVIGPGMGDGKTETDLAVRALQQDGVPVVVDADAINNLAGVAELHRDFRAKAVLTPHPGEFARLATALRIGHSAVKKETRAAAAEALAQRLGCVVVLKGAGTVVSDGHETWVCGRRAAALATAGTGDVLSGMIAGLIAQFGAGEKARLSLRECACAAVEAHAAAGELWAKNAKAGGGMLASELADLAPGVLEAMRE